MRSWMQLSSKERELFTKIFKMNGHLMPEDRFNLESLKIEMFCRPLNETEINDAETILDFAEDYALASRAY
jgi:hypothetical protein